MTEQTTREWLDAAFVGYGLTCRLYVDCIKRIYETHANTGGVTVLSGAGQRYFLSRDQAERLRALRPELFGEKAQQGA